MTAPDLSAELVDTAMLTATLVPPNGGHLVSFEVTAHGIRATVHRAPINDPDAVVDVEARCALVRAIAAYLDDVPAAPAFRDYGPGNGGTYSAIGVYHGRDVLIDAALTEDEATWLAVRLSDGME